MCHAQPLRSIQRDHVPAHKIPFRTRLVQIDGGHRATRLGRAAAVPRFFSLIDHAGRRENAPCSQ